MANNVGNALTYWLCLDRAFEEALYALRTWDDLTVAYDEEAIWVRGFTAEEITRARVLALPGARRYYSRGGRLIPYGRRLPERNEPSLLWTPIQRALPVRLPAENHNYFGLRQSHAVTLMPDDSPRPAEASIVDLRALEHYVAAAPRLRLERLLWTVLDPTRVLVLGTPLLPIPGEDYYAHECFLVPVGHRLRYDNLVRTYARGLNADGKYRYLLNERDELFKIDRSAFTPLSKGSLHLTLKVPRDGPQPAATP